MPEQELQSSERSALDSIEFSKREFDDDHKDEDERWMRCRSTLLVFS